MKLCSKEGCGRKHSAKGLCSKHYYETPQAREKQKLHRSNPEVRTKNKIYFAQNYQLNKEERDKKTKLWSINNPVRSLEIKRKYRMNHPEKDKEHYEQVKNTPEYKERMKRNHAKFETLNPNYYKDWRKANPEKKLSYDIKALEQLLPYYSHLKDSWDIAYALKHWADSVKKRDNHTCQNCGTKHRIHAHHILYPKISYPTLALDIDNGVSFCRDCHEAYHQIFDPNT